MNGRKRRAADQVSFAVEENDLDLDGLARDDRGGRLPGSCRDRIAERDVLGLRMSEGFGCGVGGLDARGERGRAAFRLGEACLLYTSPSPRDRS